MNHLAWVPPCPCGNTPPANPGENFQVPNPITLLAGAWIRLPWSATPQTIVPLGTVTGLLWVSPGRAADAASEATLSGSAYPSWFTVAPGEYWIRYAGSANIRAVILPGPYAGFKSPWLSVMTHSVITLTGATDIGLAANPLRDYALFINDSNNVMYLGLGVAAVASVGVRLNALGGNFEISGSNIWRGAINVIGTAGDKLLVTEGV